MEIIKTTVNSEAFLIVVSGVAIFVLQKMVSQLWISTIVDFKKCLGEIEALIIRFGSLYAFTEGSPLTNAFGSIDAEIQSVRKQLYDVATKLISAYCSLPSVERWFYHIQRFRVYEAKSSLLTLSVSLCSKKDWETGESQAKKEMEKVCKYLKFKRKIGF